MSTSESVVSRLCRAEARALPAYHAGLQEDLVRSRYGVTRITKLASNESPWGASPRVSAALAEWMGRLHRYPDPTCELLREALRQKTGVDARRLVFGNGSEDLIESVCKTVLAPGDRVVTLAPCFGLHEIFPLMMGATITKVPVASTFEFDLNAWREALSTPAKLVIFSTPSNPVGCVLTGAQLEELVRACPEESLIVVDEAYHEYAEGPDYPNSIEILSRQRRPWIVLRTFSKAYGLAGLRIGWGIASDAEWVSIADRVRTPFNVNGAAQVAAVAALEDSAFLQTVVRTTRHERRRLTDQLLDGERAADRGIRIASSLGNFLFLDTGRPSRLVAEALMRRGVIVKPWLDGGFRTFIRVTVGRSTDNEHFLEAFGDALAEIPRSRSPGPVFPE